MAQSHVVLLRARLRVRAVVAEVVFGLVEHVLPTDRELDPGPLLRGTGVSTMTVHLVHFVRDRGASVSFADRCRTPRIRLWSLGADVNVRSGDGEPNSLLVEFGGGQVVSLTVVSDSAARPIVAVPHGTTGPRLALF